MKKWNLVNLSTITNNLDNRRIPLNSTQRAEKESQPLYPYIGANNIMGYIDEYLFDEKILCLAEDGGSWGSNQKCAVIYNEKVWVNNHAHVLTAKEKLVLEYLMYYLNFKDLNLYINGATRGKLTQSSLNSIQIPLPPLATQKKIAAILDAADAYRQKTKTLIEKYDQLAQSVFLEMFGDPVRNPKGWKVNLLGELTKDMKYGTNCKSDEIKTEGSIAIIRIPNIQPGFIDYCDLKYSKLPEDELKKVKLKKGDLLFVRSNGNPDYIGRCAYFNSDNIVAAYASYLIRVRLLKSDKVLPLFVSFIFNYKSYRSRVLREARTTAGNYNLNTQGLKGFEIIIPPITLQNQFAERVQLIEAQKQQAEASLQKAEDLFNSLLQRAFKGELVG